MRKVRKLNETAAHELGHVIAHIVTKTYFSSVWVAGVNEWHDKQYDLTKMAGCVRSYQHGKMTFDGKRVKCITQDPDAEDWLVTLLAGVAGEEVFAGREKPRSIIEVSHDYRLSESGANSYGDFRQAQKWVKRGVEDGYIHAKEVWGVLQHYYNKAFSEVRSHKPFLTTTVPLLVKKGTMYNTEVMTLWNGFYQIESTKKESKKTSLDIKDNAQEKSAHPIPAIRVHRKMLRFEKSQLIAWVNAHTDNSLEKGTR